MYKFTDSTILNIASTIAEVMFHSNDLLQRIVAVVRFASRSYTCLRISLFQAGQIHFNLYIEKCKAVHLQAFTSKIPLVVFYAILVL